MPIDALVIGDSHSRALRSGCNAHGLKIQGFSASGSAWADRVIRFDRSRGLRAIGNRRMNRRFNRMAEELGCENIFDCGAPVLISLFNLGRLAGGLSWHNHVAVTGGGATPATIPVSAAFLRDYVLEQRRFQLGLMKRVAARAKVCVVGPPPLNFTPTSRAMHEILCDAVRDMKIALVDPYDFLPEGADSLPPEHRHEDGRHGNDAYGAWIVSQLITTGILDKPDTSDAA
ncbi:hypothetical protein EDD52_101334 [Primorskyibacter sedentarius]|uniref:GDSL-like lipase/acylhydrolase family protein n=1 Tax=Primorskyibacter sedentarius TaxID=745311 RepID=A0A4R3JQ13_9RHOB|nr:hypothetical protein [Primorskyibacter sedentarius]TCS67239.1 hypothetical protein EDD52_101334 [Primorskyibacter sedentarius]